MTNKLQQEVAEAIRKEIPGGHGQAWVYAPEAAKKAIEIMQKHEQELVDALEAARSAIYENDSYGYESIDIKHAYAIEETLTNHKKKWGS